MTNNNYNLPQFVDISCLICDLLQYSKLGFLDAPWYNVHDVGRKWGIFYFHS